MTKLRSFLIGILIGQFLMMPSLYLFWKTPKIEHEFLFAEDFFKESSRLEYQIKDVAGYYSRKKKDVYIYVVSIEELHKEYMSRFNESEENTTGLLGFWDPNAYEVWSINSVPVVLHEFRHIFEGPFHRSWKKCQLNQ